MNSIRKRNVRSAPCGAGPGRALSTRHGFTLVELLIVVAILGILATIAIPNLLEAQTRSKVAVVKNDLRVLTIALESYATDNQQYPSAGKAEGGGPGLLNPASLRLVALTTPVAFLTQARMKDPFPSKRAWPGTEDTWAYDTYDYLDADAATKSGSGATSGGAYRVVSAGPDLYLAFGGRPIANPEANEAGVDFDPTNGSVSQGDLVRVGPLHTRNGDPLDQNNPNRPGIVRVPSYVEQWQ